MMQQELTAEQKIRETITGSPVGEPHFKHEGEDVVHWLTGGIMPDAWVTYHEQGDQVAVRCAGCDTILGYLPADEKEEIAAQIIAIRLAGHDQHKPADWPQVNIIK
jgi:hypothetical protein